jgi:hypothetical protein
VSEHAETKHEVMRVRRRELADVSDDKVDL